MMSFNNAPGLWVAVKVCSGHIRKCYKSPRLSHCRCTKYIVFSHAFGGNFGKFLLVYARYNVMDKLTKCI